MVLPRGGRRARTPPGRRAAGAASGGDARRRATTRASIPARLLGRKRDTGGRVGGPARTTDGLARARRRAEGSPQAGRGLAGARQGEQAASARSGRSRSTAGASRPAPPALVVQPARPGRGRRAARGRAVDSRRASPSRPRCAHAATSRCPRTSSGTTGWRTPPLPDRLRPPRRRRGGPDRGAAPDRGRCWRGSPARGCEVATRDARTSASARSSRWTVEDLDHAPHARRALRRHRRRPRRHRAGPRARRSGRRDRHDHRARPRERRRPAPRRAT